MGPFNKLLFLNSPCNYSIKHRTKQQTSRQTKPKQNENIQTNERRKQYTRSINYSKKFSFGKIQHNIQWDKFTQFSPTEGQFSCQHYTSFQVLTKTSTYFTTFSLEAGRTQASISLECKSRLTSCVILAEGTLACHKRSEGEKKH